MVVTPSALSFTWIYGSKVVAFTVIWMAPSSGAGVYCRGAVAGIEAAETKDTTLARFMTLESILL